MYSPQVCNQFEIYPCLSWGCHHKCTHPGSLGLLSEANQGPLFYESNIAVEPDRQQSLLSLGLNNGQIQVTSLWLQEYCAHMLTIDGNNWGVGCARHSWTILRKWAERFLAICHMTTIPLSVNIWIWWNCHLGSTVQQAWAFPFP